ncbi:MAG: hypothetical protein JWM91_1283 [Rhodospirillales bacterium]|nr:hypothetical protein [Rhodospirillales bacterium]
MLATTLRKNLLGAVIVAPSLLLAGTALAAPQLLEHREPLSALGDFDPASVSLPTAITTIEAKTGGKVMNIRFDDAGGAPVYDAVVTTSNNVGLARLDARTGVLSGFDHNQVSDQSFDWEHQRDLKSFAKATVPLSKAIATVEQVAGTPAVNAGLATPLTPSNDVLAYNIEVVKYGRAQRVAVDATTDELIADPSALGLSDRDPAEFLPVAPQ